MENNGFVSAVVYAHNCEKTVGRFLTGLSNCLKELFGCFELIVVNDSSTDMTRDEVTAFGRDYDMAGGLSLVNLSYFHGCDKAMIAGDDLAIGDYIFEFDDVCQDYDWTLVQKVLDKCMSGYDIVSAVPDEKPDFLTRIFYSIYNKHSASDGNMIRHESFRVLSRRAYNRVKSNSNNYFFRRSEYANCGLPTASIMFEPNSGSKRTLDKKEKSQRREMAVDTLVLYTNVVTKVLLTLSIIFLVFAVIVGVYTVVCYLFDATKPVEGWAPIMGVLSVGFAGLFMILFLVTKYLSLMLKGIYSKSTYVVESVEKIS